MPSMTSVKDVLAIERSRYSVNTARLPKAVWDSPTRRPPVPRAVGSPDPCVTYGSHRPWNDGLQNARSHAPSFPSELRRRRRKGAHYKKWRDTVSDMMAEPRQAVKFTNAFPDDEGW